MTIDQLATRLDRIEALLERALGIEQPAAPVPTVKELLQAKELAAMGRQKTKEYFDLIAKQQKAKRKGRATR